MKYLFLIQKSSNRAFGINPWFPHQIFSCKKDAEEQCKKLNSKAQHYKYEVIKVPNGDFWEFGK